MGSGIFYLLYPQSFDPNLAEVRKLFASVPAIAANPWLGMLSLFLQVMFISLIGPAPTGLVGMLGYLILALVLLFNRKAFAKQKAAGSEKVQAAAGA